MILGRYRQRPGDSIRRQVNYHDFLESSEVISGVVPTVSPVTTTPLTVSGVVVDVGGKKFAYVVSGGEDGASYDVSFRIQTSTGQIKNDTIGFDIEEDE